MTPWLEMGEVTCPGGSLVLADPTTFDAWPVPDGQVAPGCAFEPTARPIRVTGRRCEGRQNRIDAVRIVWRDRPGLRREPLGTVVSPAAMLLVADAGALTHWVGDRSLDGLSDYVIWGPGAAEVAKRFGLVDLRDGSFGVVNQPEPLVVGQVMQIEALREREPGRFASDYRPHSHRHLLLGAMWELQRGCGTMELGGATICGFFTSWGPGACLVSAERAPDGELCGVWIQLAPSE